MERKMGCFIYMLYVHLHFYCFVIVVLEAVSI